MIWTKDEIIKLRRLCEQDRKTYVEVGKELNKSPTCVSTKAYRLGLKKVKNHKHSEKTKRFLRIQKLGKKNPNWKGNKVGYNSLHDWIRSNKPKPIFCENCGKAPPKDLANISGKYKRDINDFEWLCRKCHMKKDKRLINFNKKRRNAAINGSAKRNNKGRFI